MSKKQCSVYPEINGSPSVLFKELLKKVNDKTLTNYIYACYLQQGVAAQMNNQGFKVNKQGQHSADAVYQFFDVASMKNEVGKLASFERRIGARDNFGNLVDFTNSKDALQKAFQANLISKGTVSYVVRNDDIFNILTEERNSRTQIKAFEVEEKQKIWGIVEQAFNGVGIDVNNNFNFNRNLINANESRNFLQWVKRLKTTKNEAYSEKEIKTILAMDENSSQVQRLKQMFGSLDEVASKVYDGLHRGKQNYTQGQLALINSAIDNCKDIRGLDVNALLQQVSQVTGDLRDNSYEIKVQSTLDELNNEYNLDVHEISRKLNEPIKYLHDAAADAAVTLQRRLKKLKSEQGITPEVKQLETTINNLVREIANKRYYSGVMGFLSDAINQVQTMEVLLRQAYETTGTSMEQNALKSKTLMEIKRTKEGYYHIVEALSRIDDIIVNESISSTDKQSIQDQARAVKGFFDTYDSKIKEVRKDVMIDIACEYLGDKTSNGVAIADIVQMADADSTVWDFLYSASRMSNPLIAVMGNVIRDAQGERTKALNEITLRIQKATHALYKSGSDTTFMYEPDSDYIISDIDWIKYEDAKAQAREKIFRQGARGLALEVAINNWEKANTEDRVVDSKSGRTERIPNKNYRKAFPDLNPAQREYYNTVMQIKGELGTLLPNYAQKQYLPPQKRREFIDAMYASKGNPKAIAKAILNKFKDIYSIREDDPHNTKENVILDGNADSIKAGNLDNSPYKQIPIFYINRIKDQKELLKDFSGALQAFAGTAINYDCINRIRDTVELMGDFIKDQEVSPEEGNYVDAVINKGVVIYKQLRGKAKATNTEGIIDGLIDKFIYDEKLKDTGKWTKLARSILYYTSLRSLAVNVKGAIANLLVGELQMIIEAGADEFYGFKDYAWATAKVFGDNTVGSYGRIMDFVTNNTNSKAVLLANRFDPLNETFNEQSGKRYYKGVLRHLLGKDFTFIGYGAGEHMLHFTNMYAVLHNTKVKINGKDATLYDAFKIGNKSNGSSELLMKSNVTHEDAEGNWVPIDDTFLDSVRDRIRYVNQTTHGSMNEEDKGLVHQRMLGRFVMCLRQWMVEHYSRRFRASHLDTSLKEWREGYYRTVGKLIAAWANDLLNFESEAAIHWNDMTIAQKANVKRALTEQLILANLLCLAFGLGEPEDHKKEFWYRMWIYQTKRAIMEVKGSTPYGLPMEMNKLINSPIAATNTVNSLMYIFTGLPDIDDEIRSGRYKGWNKYGRNMLKYWVPFYNQIDQLQNMDEDEGIFAVFDNDMK